VWYERGDVVQRDEVTHGKIISSEFARRVKMKRLRLSFLGLAIFSLMLVVACATEKTEIVEVVKEVVVEKVVVKEVEVKVPGETIVVEKEVIKEVPVEVIVTQQVIKEVTKEVVVEVMVEASTGIEYKESPMLAKLVANNALPPVADRLPKDPLVVSPSGREAQIGQFGGTMRRCGRTSDHWSYGYIAPEGMVRFAQDGRTLIPQMATSWTASEDDRVWTVKIREGMRWSDGAPFTMADMMFEYEDVILNDELMPAKPSKLMSGGEIVVFAPLDATTIQFRFKESFASFPDVMAQLNRARGMEQTLWAPKHYMKQFHIKYNPNANELAKAEGLANWVELYATKDDPVMNPDRPNMRPWILTTRVIDPKMKAVRNPYYYGVDPAGNQLPYIDRIEWTTINDREVAFLEVIAGNIDFDRGCGIGITKYPLLKENEARGNYRTLQALTPGRAGTVNMNQSYEGREGKWIRTKDFRLALGLAIDRDAINQVSYLGLAELMNPMPQPGHPYYPGDEYKYMNTEYNLDKANALLDKIGLDKRDGEGYRVESDGYRPHLLFRAQECDDTVEIIVSGWNLIGLKSTCKPVERSVIYATSADNSMMFAGGAISNSPFIFAVPSHTAPVDHKLVNNMGAAYAVWHETGGEEGIEPPQEIKELIKLHVDGAAALTPEARAEFAKEILRRHATEQWQLAVTGNAPGIYVASNDLMNVPDTWIASFINRYYAVTFPEQMWFKPTERRNN